MRTASASTRPAISSARGSRARRQRPSSCCCTCIRARSRASSPSPRRSRSGSRPEALARDRSRSAARARARSSSGADSTMPSYDHTTFDRAAQHRAHRRERLDRRRGGRQCRHRLSRDDMARASDPRLDARATVLSLRRRAPGRRPTPPSSPCPITRRRRSPRALAARGAGGFVCFSSGFCELGTPLGRAARPQSCVARCRRACPSSARTAMAS